MVVPSTHPLPTCGLVISGCLKALSSILCASETPKDTALQSTSLFAVSSKSEKLGPLGSVSVSFPSL